jgi:hypothetical protein
MSSIYSSEGYFCENEVQSNWQFSMRLGKILLTNHYLALVEKSNINLTEIGSSIDDYNEGYKIPLEKIQRVYPLKQGKIYTVKVETRDNHHFSITLADEENYGKRKCQELSKVLNSTILQMVNIEQKTPEGITDMKSKVSIKYCTYCGSENHLKANYCKNCGTMM